MLLILIVIWTTLSFPAIQKKANKMTAQHKTVQPKADHLGGITQAKISGCILRQEIKTDYLHEGRKAC
ncbi:hypothetical protein CXF72_16015 [Psychromonas sp. MB-3u-54]|nr:hypothetical protein CXF72_16015 [Psychromonas sp. MB-3u-54]